MFSFLRKKKAKQGRPIVPIHHDDSCSSSKQALQPAHNKQQEKQSPNRMSSFTRHFYCCNSMDDADAGASVVEFDATMPPTAIIHSKHDDDDGDVRSFVLNLLGPLTADEARAIYRMQSLTDSQWAIVMENCGLRMGVSERVTSMAEMVKIVMEWRRERGDFRRDENEEKEEQWHEFEGAVGVPRLSDDMQEANEAMLKLVFLKTDLQVECLLRGISYKGGDTKEQLISMLMHHKQSLLLNSGNSFQVLAEQSSA
ncbi:hypothetical protein GOP47_0015114 [Adiantum capillus-veneris]|uniref:Uncharacterized protein n=1 Tax=Adiantum capillus-veneris TaxID=13818 RepID=A0A9D4UNF4_ADICA|nr:hypothetical protein GOP47_0015114 [Adiantum capillus-veneris]